MSHSWVATSMAASRVAIAASCGGCSTAAGRCQALAALFFTGEMSLQDAAGLRNAFAGDRSRVLVSEISAVLP